MYRPTNKHAYKKPYILVVTGIVCAFVCAFFLKSGTAYAGGTPPGGNITDPGVRAVDIAAPAVVRIITTMNGHLTVHFSSTSNITFPQSSSSSYQAQVSGTGTFITSKGDILTADHVVNPPKDQTLNQYLFTLAAQNVADYMNQNGQGQVTKDQVLQQLSSGQLSSTTSFDPPSSEAFLSTSYTGPLTATDFNSLPTQIYAKVDQIEKESPPDQKDLAVVHVSSMTDTPSVQLGDSSNVQVQDTLTIIGFPGNADVSQKPTDLLTSSINKISVSSIKTTNSGAPVIQVGGNVEHGDSGGPALDTNGTVVGIVSFGLVSTDTPGSTSGTSFLQASNSARDLVTSLNLDTTPGTFQKLWNQAFTDYAANTPGHWHKAATEFTQLATNYPQFKAVTQYQNYAQTQAQSEPQTTTTQVTPVPTPTASSRGNSTSSSRPTSSSPVSLPAMALTIGVVIVVLLLVVALFATIVRPRNKKKAKAPANNQPAAPKEAKATSGGPLKSQQAAPAKPTPIPNPKTPPPPVPSIQGLPNTPQSTLTLKAWPCGHMNRPNAKFCSICGEPAPTPPTTRQVGQ